MSKKDDAYISTSQQVLLAVFEVLVLRPFEGVTLEQATRYALRDDGMTSYSRDQVYRALRNLEHRNWAEQTEGGAWRVTSRVTKASERARLALADLHRAYLANPNHKEDAQ